MAVYTVKLLGPDGELRSEMTADHASDDKVIDAVGFLDHPHTIEIWDGDRHVATFPAGH